MSGRDARPQCCVRLPPLCCSFGGEGFFIVSKSLSPLADRAPLRTNFVPQSPPKSAALSTFEYAQYSPPPHLQSPPPSPPGPTSSCAHNSAHSSSHLSPHP